MKKIYSAVLLLFLFCGVGFAATTSTTEYDPFSLNYLYLNENFESQVYGRYGSSTYNFFYQLRDITGSTRNENVAGPQWFATVYENYYRYNHNRLLSTTNQTSNTTISGDIYRRTMGGETPEVTFSTVGDIIDGFNFIFAEEPQPYESYRRKLFQGADQLGAYDFYPDPVESLCLVITNGQGDFNIDFGNPYARHFPFWWGRSDTAKAVTNTKWWDKHVNWNTVTYPTAEPIRYIYSDNKVYEHTDNLNEYKVTYNLVASGDISYINDTSGTLVYTLSSDALYDTNNNLCFTISGDKIYNASNTLLYTIESDTSTNGDKYICETRTVNQQIEVTGFDDDFRVTIQPSTEKAISSGESLSSNVRIRGTADVYGSTLGYLTFRQRASFATGYSNYREYTTLPVVVANVANGGAEVEPLIFDIIIYDGNNNVVSRKKFTWDVQSDLQQDLGSFVVMDTYNDDEENQDSAVTTYKLETRITNRTGTRYELFRYDGISSRNSTVEYRDKYRNIMPDYWKYDLTRDTYGTLPDKFLLDAHSQIAPGLITVYGENIGEGYSSMIVGNVITNSFRLYEYSNPTPRNLSFTYRRIGGNTIAAEDAGTPQTIKGSSGESSTVQAFSKYFADDNETKATLADLYNLMGKIPVVIPIEILNNADPVVPAKLNNAGADTTNSFRIVYPVPDGFVPYTEVIEEEETSGDQTTETETETNTEENNNNTTEENNNNNNEENNAAAFEIESSAKIVYDTENQAAILPLKIRMTLPRNNSFIRNAWDELDAAENSDVLFNKFAELASVWVKVPSTIAYDGEADLFRAVDTAENRGGVEGVSAIDCFDISINDENDELYIDFTVFIADTGAPASRQNVDPENPVVSAFVYTFEDDKVPYILIGDGDVDKVWNVSFFVAAPAEETSGSSTTETNPVTTSSGSSSSCNFGMIGISGLILLFVFMKVSYRSLF